MMAIESLLQEVSEKMDKLSAQLDSFQAQAPADGGKIGLSVKEAADLVDVSEPTYRSWINTLYAPGTKINGCVKVSRRALEEWMYQKSLEHTRLES